MLSKVKIHVGFDPRASVVYHTFIQSLIETSTLPIEITPLAVSTLNFYEESHQDKSNDFVYSRFLTPFIVNPLSFDVEIRSFNNNLEFMVKSGVSTE